MQDLSSTDVKRLIIEMLEMLEFPAGKAFGMVEMLNDDFYKRATVYVQSFDQEFQRTFSLMIYCDAILIFLKDEINSGQEELLYTLNSNCITILDMAFKEKRLDIDEVLSLVCSYRFNLLGNFTNCTLFLESFLDDSKA